jgi:hypothetical protein
MLGGPLGFSYVIFHPCLFEQISLHSENGETPADGLHDRRFAPILKTKFPGVAKALKPLANLYVDAAGYRKMGLRYDDLIVEEREDVQKVSCEPDCHSDLSGRVY